MSLDPGFCSGTRMRLFALADVDGGFKCRAVISRCLYRFKVAREATGPEVPLRPEAIG